jgi:hypothetical protein
MNTQPDRDLELRLQELEAQLTPPSPLAPQPQQTAKLQTEDAGSASSSVERLMKWFDGLPGVGKLAVIGVAAIVGFAILRSVLHLIASLVSLALLGMLLYLAYKFFFASVLNSKD